MIDQEMPKGTLVRLGSVTSPSKERDQPTVRPDVPYVGLEHIERGRGTLNGWATSAEAKSLKSVFRAGDLLYGKLRPYLNKVWLAQFGGVCSTDILVFPGSEGIGNAYLKYRLMTTDFVNYATAHCSGVNLPRVSPRALADFMLWLPPIPEQQRIVAKIEELFTRLDAGLASLRLAKARIERYRQAMLRDAFAGRLTATWRDARPKEGDTGVQALLGDLCTQRREKRACRRGCRPPLAAVDQAPLPPGWRWESLDSCSSLVTSGSRAWSKYYGRGSGTFIMAQNVRPLCLDLGERQSVDPAESDPERIRTHVEEHDLLVTIVGAGTGDVCRVPVPLSEHYVCQSVALVRPALPQISRYLEFFLAAEEHGQAQWRKVIYGQGRPHLGLDDLRRTAIPLCSLAEQGQIVAEIERHFSLAAAAEAALEQAEKRANALRQSILKEAFAGRLV